MKYQLITVTNEYNTLTIIFSSDSRTDYTRYVYTAPFEWYRVFERKKISCTI